MAMVRYEIAARFGYGRTVGWHRAPNAAEREQVEAALETVGGPCTWADDPERGRDRFLETVCEVVDASAPMRRRLRGPRGGRNL